MGFQLRPYQDELLGRARAALKSHRSVVLQLATGGGKTGIATTMLEGVARKGMVGNFFVHRQELVEQTVRTFNEYGIPHAVLCAGWPSNPHEPIQICSIDTVKSRLAAGVALPRSRFNVFDECHHIGAAGWKRVMDYYTGALNVGLTATPERLDGVGLVDSFASMVCGPSVGTLIDQGWLCDYRAFAPDEPDFSKVYSVAGEYAVKQSAAIMDTPAITGNAIRVYLRNTPDAPAIGFGVNRAHSEHVAEQFRDAGISAVHIDGETDRGLRREAIRDFARGNIKVLMNVSLFGEGFDVPEAVTMIDLARTQSLAKWLQRCGRVLRLAPGKRHAFLQVHSGNLRVHGRPDAPHSWTLAGTDRRGAPRESCGGERLLRCPGCTEVIRLVSDASTGTLRCRNCGFHFRPKPGFPEAFEGELRELPRLERAAGLRLESAGAETVEDLIVVGTRRGYKDPVRWAKNWFMAKHADAAE